MQRSIAIFPWGQVIEDFLGPIGLTVADYAQRMTGGWLFGYVAALQSAGWRPVILYPSSSVTAPTRLEHVGTGTPIWLVPGVSVPLKHYGRSLQSVKRWASTPIRAFRAILEQEGCSAILAQEYEDARFDRLVQLGRSLRIPVFATFQGGDLTYSRAEALVRPHSLRRCAGLIVAAAAERIRLAARYPAVDLTIANIPNPLDTIEWQPIDRAQARGALQLDKDSFIAINHGRIDVRRKGLDVLLQAWRQSGEGTLVIIGSGQDDEQLASLLAQSGSDSVRWIKGYSTDRSLMRTWISAADIYVTASRVEGMPVAPLEAMACGLPIVATDAQGLPDILEEGQAHGGLIVPRDDPSALAAAICFLRSDPALRNRLGRAARQRVEQHFSIAEVGKSLDHFLSTAV
jgi:glycosyltransferase involved in cell wall biosynthesis